MQHLFLNWTGLDFVIAAILLFSIIVSFFRGFLREAISLLTWFLAFVGALKFAPDVSNLLHSVISSPKSRYVVAAVLIFILVLILGMIVNKLAHALVTTSGLGFIDKILGFIFGVARGLLFVTIMLLIIQASPFQNDAWVKKSQIAPYYQPYVTHFSDLLPKEIKTVSSWVGHLTSRANALTPPVNA